MRHGFLVPLASVLVAAVLGPAQYFGLYEHNDTAGRLMAIANYNTNLAEYWQMAGSGFFPVDPGNEAFKLGINYIVYAMTH